MQFARKLTPGGRKGTPLGLKKQVMFQLVVLVMVSGLLFILWRVVRRDDAPRAGREPPSPAAAPLPSAIGSAGATEEEPELVGPVAPEPFVERPEVLFEAAAREAKRELDVDAVLYLLHRARSEGETLRTARPALSALRGDEVWKELVAHPSFWRGKLVEIRGNLYSRSRGDPFLLDTEMLLEFPNPAGVPSVYRTYLLDRDRFFLVATWKEEWGEPLSHWDGAVLRGYFAQLYPFRTEVGEDERDASMPLIVVGDVRKIAASLGTRDTDWGPLFGLVLVIGIGGACIAWLIVRRGARGYEGRRRTARRGRSSESGGVTPPLSEPDPTPDRRSG